MEGRGEPPYHTVGCRVVAMASWVLVLSDWRTSLDVRLNVTSAPEFYACHVM
jgi:hypothetical protein